MEDREKSILKILAHFEEEEKKSMLGGMAWDDVSWNLYDLKNDYGYIDEKLKELFPNLCVDLR